MTVIGVLFVVGVILLGFEVFLPGGILGVFAGLALLGGCVLAFVDYGLAGGILAVLTAGALVAAMLYFELSILPKTTLGQRFFLNSAIQGKASANSDENLRGKSGRTVTALAPSGFIVIDGKRHEAFSRAGFLEADTAVEVVDSDNFRLIVTPKNP